ncbi:hypothetical protein BREVUG8_10308 [Brevundimonas sp. G8]|nr:hypothetical protein BREVUG8_10308 [Brevundimonas sp. G8]
MSGHAHDRPCRRPSDFRTGDHAASARHVGPDPRSEQRSPVTRDGASLAQREFYADASPGPHDNADPAANRSEPGGGASPGADDIPGATPGPDAKLIQYASPASHRSKPGCDASSGADDILGSTFDTGAWSNDDGARRVATALCFNRDPAPGADHRCTASHDARTRHSDPAPRNACACRARHRSHRRPAIQDRAGYGSDHHTCARGRRRQHLPGSARRSDAADDLRRAVIAVSDL